MKKETKNIIILSVLWTLAAILIYWLFLPSINIKSIGFWIYSIVILAPYMLILNTGLTLYYYEGKNSKNYTFIPKLIFGIVVAGFLIFAISSLSMFQSGTLQKIANVAVQENESQNKRLSGFTGDNIPVIDNQQADILGARAMGSLPDVVGLYQTPNYYTTNIYKDRLVRVAPLEYSGFINKIRLNGKGIPGYITVDMVNGESDYVKTENPILYSTDAFFLSKYNLSRHIKNNYSRTKMYYAPNFELDENGNPYWIVTEKVYTAGMFGGSDFGVVIAVNASTGEITEYDKDALPDWIDRVYETDTVMNQLSNYGKYKSGFWNSIFGKKGVVLPAYDYLSDESLGYSYVMLKDEDGNNRLYVYTGQTSDVSNDESNIGFTLTNLRTKETEEYKEPLSEEMSAMKSAEGVVQEKGYTASFPFLIYRHDKPMYFTTLKDDGGLTRLFAVVDAKDYSKVATGTGAAEALANMDKLNGIITTEKTIENQELKTAKVVVPSSKKILVIGGESTYVFMHENVAYAMKASLDFELVWQTKDITLDVVYRETENYREIVKINK